MILTDEHSVRTLGCYRDFMKSQNETEQAFVWGEGIEVETPHIDRLASEGALFTNFHTVAPLCTPSRASFMSGLFPQKTGESEDNHGRIDDHISTFAKVLKWNKQYDTSYLGKWHLNGDKKPGWGNKKRKFGFDNTYYQFNRGHWKYLDVVNGTRKAYDFTARPMFEEEEEENFTTDYLFDRGIEIMQSSVSEEKPFAMVLSIPDPHGPNEVRKPYEDMYKKFNFSVPMTTVSALNKDPAVPDWNYHEHEGVPLDDVDTYLDDYQNSDFFQNYMQQYFGMVKCIDNNIGKLLDYLSTAGIDKDTIIV